MSISHNNNLIKLETAKYIMNNSMEWLFYLQSVRSNKCIKFTLISIYCKNPSTISSIELDAQNSDIRTLALFQG
jgi:hypothetical protein